jgi:hypothetical protein
MSSASLVDWNRLLGARVAGAYSINELLGESGGAAFFRASRDPDARPALLQLIPATAAGDAQLALWSRITRLSHPNLLALLDYGRGEEAGDAFLYAAFEFPDDTLAAAIGRAPLSESESREVHQAISDALRYVHSQGLVHTAVDGGHIIAVGNQIKLASDTLRESSASLTAAADFTRLDRLLPGAAPLPEPRALLPPPPEPAAAPRASTRSFPVWAYAALAVLLGGLGYLFFPKTEPPRTPATANSRPQPVPPAPASEAAPAASVPSQPAAPRQAAAPRREYWRVIAYTYSSHQAAQRRADDINHEWPSAEAEVFSPEAGRAPYLVALGGRMDRDAAVRLLKIAHGKGLPRDIYIQNYAR